MGWYYTVEYNEEAESKVNAGGKAREDICKILGSLQMNPINIQLVAGRDARSAWGKLAAHREALSSWLNGVNGLGRGDVLVIQFPVLTHIKDAFLGSRITLNTGEKGFIAAYPNDFAAHPIVSMSSGMLINLNEHPELVITEYNPK